MTDTTDVLEVLGNHRWTTIADLSNGLGLSRRSVESAVEALRLAGEPIVADAAGLCLTDNPRELESYVERRRHRAASIHRGTLALRSTLRRLREATELTLGF